MTRARCYALAVVVGLCVLGHTPAFAQSGPPAPGSGPGAEFDPNGYPPAPYATPIPEDGGPWYGSPEEIEASRDRVGPLVRTDGGFLRVEYLNWTIQKPGNELMGAPVAGVADPTKPFIAYIPGTTVPLAAATVPDTSTINLGNASGLQVTGGVNFLDGGSLEVGAFMLARKESGFTLGNFGNAQIQTDNSGNPLAGGPIILPSVLATSTLSNGQVSDHLLLYNQSFQAVFQSQLWGGEANYFYDADSVGILQFRPLIGVRYINLTERLTQTGVFQDLLVTSPPIVTTIDSHTINNLWGGQIGFRTQFVTKYLEWGLTPKVLLLGNSMVSDVYTNHLRTNGDPTVSSSNNVTQFTFGFDAATYLQLNLTPSFSVRAGYNVLWLGRVTRPQSDVYYNDGGAAAPPGVISQINFHDILISGLTVGCEFRF